MMTEFLIRRTDAEWFDFPSDRYPEVLRPNSFPSRVVPGWGNHRIECLGAEISFSEEDPGFQVCFETGNIDEPTARKIVDEIRANIERLTGQGARVVEI